MFGSSNGNGNGNNGSGPAPGNRPKAASVARIENNVTHVLVSGASGPDAIAVFINAQPVHAGELDSVSINIVAPQNDTDPGTVTAVVSRYQTDATGARVQKGVSLFPGTIEVIIKNRRLVITCQNEGQFDGLWLGLGLNADGTSTDLSGVQSLRVTLTPDVRDARLEWADGSGTEDLLA